MASTLEMPKSTDVQEVAGRPSSPRWLWLAVVVLGLLSIGLGVALVAATDDDDTAVPEATGVPTIEETNDEVSSPAVPADVDQLLNDFGTAWKTADSDLFRSIATEDFFYNEDFYSPGAVAPDFSVGGPLFSMANGIDSSTFQVERFGEVIVTGDGPWVVSVGETWLDYANRWDGTATYLILDDGGTLKIDEYDWVGVSTPVQPDFGN